MSYESGTTKSKGGPRVGRWSPRADAKQASRVEGRRSAAALAAWSRKGGPHGGGKRPIVDEPADEPQIEVYRGLTAYACGGIIAEDGIVVEAAPIFGWTVGKAVETVRKWKKWVELRKIT